MLKESKDAIICKLFPQSLKCSALKWFYQLALGSVGTFKEMTKVFLENYSANINKGTTPGELRTIIQQPGESLRNYIKRLSKAVAEIPNCDDTNAPFCTQEGPAFRIRFLE